MKKYQQYTTVRDTYITLGTEASTFAEKNWNSEVVILKCRSKAVIHNS